MPPEPTTADRERLARDLRTQLSDIGSDLKDEVVFQHIRTRREPVTLYAMSDGEPISVPEYMVGSLMTKRAGEGYMFTNNPEEAPAYKRGNVKCFLHAESIERQAGLLDEIGLSGKQCIAGSLANEHSKDMHGQHRHRQEYTALQSFLEKQERQADRDRQERQLEATLALARGATGQAMATALAVCPVDGCGYEGTPKQVQGHQMGAHKG